MQCKVTYLFCFATSQDVTCSCSLVFIKLNLEKSFCDKHLNENNYKIQHLLHILLVQSECRRRRNFHRQKLHQQQHTKVSTKLQPECYIVWIQSSSNKHMSCYKERERKPQGHLHKTEDVKQRELWIHSFQSDLKHPIWITSVTMTADHQQDNSDILHIKCSCHIFYWELSRKLNGRMKEAAARR